MRRLRLVLFCLACLSVSVGSGAEPLNLYTGKNVVVLSVMQDMPEWIQHPLTLSSGSSMPQWVTLNSQPAEFNEGTYDFRAVLTVSTSAPEPVTLGLPFEIKDAGGHIWEVLVRVNLWGVYVATEDRLEPNFPNPFNPQTSIFFSLSGAEPRLTTLIIYNQLGQQVRTLVNELLYPGHHEVIWDGQDDRGQRVSSGVYLYQLRSGQFSSSRQMLLLK